MTWRRINPPSTMRAASPRDAVAVGMSPGGGKRAPRLTITMRGGMLGSPAMLAPNARITVLIGEGDDAGRLRLQAGEDFGVYQPGGKRPAPDLVVLRIPLPDGVEPSARAPQPVAYFQGSHGIDITLPAWARPAPPPTGNATPPARGAQLAQAAADIARQRAGR